MDEIDGIDAPQKVDAKELSPGKTLVDNLAVEKSDPGQYSDTYAKELKKLIEAKSKGQQITIKEEEKEPEATPDCFLGFLGKRNLCGLIVMPGIFSEKPSFPATSNASTESSGKRLIFSLTGSIVRFYIQDTNIHSYSAQLSPKNGM
jgi:hypothetical protein